MFKKVAGVTSSEYVKNMHADRDIETISVNILYCWERFTITPFTFGVGMTATYAWGNITQLDDNLSAVSIVTVGSSTGKDAHSCLYILAIKSLHVLF